MDWDWKLIFLNFLNVRILCFNLVYFFESHV